MTVLSLFRFGSNVVNKLTHNTIMSYNCVFPLLNKPYFTMNLNTLQSVLQKIVVSPPKRPPTAYSLYFTNVNKQIRQENPDLKPVQLVKIVAQKWKQLNDEEKRGYIEKGREMMKNYSEEREKFFNVLSADQKELLETATKLRRKNIARRRLKIELRKLDYPSRPGNAFNMFVQEVLNKKLTKDFKKIGEMWKDLDEFKRAKYKQLANQQKIKYLSDLESWKAKVSKAENLSSVSKLAALRAQIAQLNNTKKTKEKKLKKTTKKAKQIKAKRKLNN